MNRSIASTMPYVRQNAPMIPRFAVGSSCLASLRRSIASAPGTWGHWVTSFQSPYIPSSPSRLQNGLSYTWYTYWLSLQQLGQYMSL